MEVDFIIGKLKPNKLTEIPDKDREGLNAALFQYGKLNAQYGYLQGIHTAMKLAATVAACAFISAGIIVGINLFRNRNKKEKNNE